MVGEQVAVLKIRVELDLVNCGAHFSRLQDGLQVRLEVVADADAFRLAAGGDLFHLRPCLLEQRLIIFRPKRLVDKVQVNIVKAELFQARVDGPGDIVDVGDDFGRHEQLLPRYAAFPDRLAELLFVFVELGAVEVKVARVDG